MKNLQIASELPSLWARCKTVVGLLRTPRATENVRQPIVMRLTERLTPNGSPLVNFGSLLMRYRNGLGGGYVLFLLG